MYAVSYTNAVRPVSETTRAFGQEGCYKVHREKTFIAECQPAVQRLCLVTAYRPPYFGAGLVGIALALAGAEVVLTDLEHILPLTQQNLAANLQPHHRAQVGPPPC